MSARSDVHHPPYIYNIPTLCIYIYSRLYYIVSASFFLFLLLPGSTLRLENSTTSAHHPRHFGYSAAVVSSFPNDTHTRNNRHIFLVLTYRRFKKCFSTRKRGRPNGHLATVMERQKGGPGSAAVTSKFPPTFRQLANETIRQKEIETLFFLLLSAGYFFVLLLSEKRSRNCVMFPSIQRFKDKKGNTIFFFFFCVGASASFQRSVKI